MSRKTFGIWLLGLFFSLLFSQLTWAEVKGDYGGAFRLRQEYWENLIDLETRGMPDRDFFRLRTNLWGKVDFSNNFGIYARVGNEARYYLGSYRPFPAPDDGQQFDEDELFIDNLYLDFKNVFGAPVDLRIGRQDFLGVFGEGFLILDGTPADGSRSFYFNAVRATVKFNKNNSVELVYLTNPEKDIYLPSWYPSRPASYGFSYIDNKRRLNASDERGAIVYGKSKVTDTVTIEPYYIFKTEETVGANKPLRINTIGARAVFANAAGWKVRGEFAHQFGEYDDNRDRKANGGYLFVGRRYDKVAFKPEWELGYVYLSGDDKTTPENEGWDPLFSRAPMWNELYIYTMTLETAGEGGALPGYWTNLHLVKFGLKFALAATTNLSASYQYLRADENTNLTGANAAMFSNTSKERGHLATLMLTHAFSKNLDGFIQAEYFFPGNFYTDKAKEAAFLRWQLQYKF